MYDDGSIIVEKTDQCFSCKHFVGKATCPLLTALGQGVVVLADIDLGVHNCALYEYGLHLRLLELKQEEDD